MGCSQSRTGAKSTAAATGKKAKQQQQPSDKLEAKPPTNMNGMLLSDEAMSILLALPSEDAQSVCLWKAAERVGAACDSASSPEEAMEKYIGGHHDLVIVDRRRGSSDFPADSLAKSMRAVSQSDFTSFVAVTAAPEPQSLHDLIRVGYDMKFVESTSIDACCDLLLSVQHNCFRYQQKLTALAAVFTALDGCSDAVEICNDKFQIQYVNACHERLFGQPVSELVGKNAFDAAKSDKSPDEVAALQQTLRKGHEWEGTSSTWRRKSGGQSEGSNCQSHYYPVKGRRGKLQHIVTVTQHQRRPPTAGQQQQQSSRVSSAANSDTAAGAATAMDTAADIGIVCSNDSADAMKRSRSEMLGIIRKTSTQSMRSISSIPLDASLFGTLSRMARMDRGSAKIGSQSLEAPIHKVINLINLAQENSPPLVTNALDRVLEILHQATDLYSGELPAGSADDRITSDYVGGLMTGAKPSEKKRPVGHLATRRHQPHRVSEILNDHINQLLESSMANMQSLSEIPERFIGCLEGDDEWSFDIMELERVTNSRPLVYLGMRIMQRFNVCQFLQCSEDTMLNWLQVIQDNYHADNCYHNATHGADVMQSSAYFLERDRIKSVFDEMDETASLLAALVHDLDHPGRTNPFLINSQHRLALLYNDLSVLESHHVSLAFQLTTRDDRINIFKNLPREDYRALRQSMVDIVLATEMARHFEHVGKFANQIVAPLVAKEGEGGMERITEEETVEMLSKTDNRVLIKRVLIKCADISNQCRPLKLCREWSRRISEEYFQQTDEERAKGLPIVMPVFDRTTCNLPQSQMSFIDFFLREMFTVWHAFCEVPQLLENMNNNYAYWKQLSEQQQQQQQHHEKPLDSQDA